MDRIETRNLQRKLKTPFGELSILQVLDLVNGKEMAGIDLLATGMRVVACDRPHLNQGKS